MKEDQHGRQSAVHGFTSTRRVDLYAKHLAAARFKYFKSQHRGMLCPIHTFIRSPT